MPLLKCPYKYRDSSLTEVLKHDKSYIIYKNDEGTTEVNTSHPYWDQIQGQLHITKRRTCYLVVWTPAHCEIVVISRDDEWSQNIQILKNFYIQHCLKMVSG